MLDVSSHLQRPDDCRVAVYRCHDGIGTRPVDLRSAVRDSEPIGPFGFRLRGGRDNERVLADISPSSRVEFSVEDEGGMAFRVRYTDGRDAAFEPFYFTLGTTVIATMTKADIDVRSDRDI